MTTSKDEPIVFIDENIQVFEGEEAASRLATKADSPGDPDMGTVQASLERWQEAQRYERKTWMVNSLNAKTDRNEHHEEKFLDYQALRGRHFQRGIELGCGPFTNMRYLLEQVSVGELHLLDPLINDYLQHPACSYATGYLLPPPLNYRVPKALLKRLLAKLRSPNRNPRPAVILHQSPIETFQSQGRFDLVVMINVLEHCFNANEILEKILDILLPNGVFVFHDRLYSPEERARLSATLYDAGHPLRVGSSLILDFLKNNFAPLLQREIFVEQEFRGLKNRNHELYYIGTKLEHQAQQDRVTMRQENAA